MKDENSGQGGINADGNSALETGRDTIGGNVNVEGDQVTSQGNVHIFKGPATIIETVAPDLSSAMPFSPAPPSSELSLRFLKNRRGCTVQILVFAGSIFLFGLMGVLFSKELTSILRGLANPTAIAITTPTASPNEPAHIIGVTASTDQGDVPVNYNPESAECWISFSEPVEFNPIWKVTLSKPTTITGFRYRLWGDLVERADVTYNTGITSTIVFELDKYKELEPLFVRVVPAEQVTTITFRVIAVKKTGANHIGVCNIQVLTDE